MNSIQKLQKDPTRLKAISDQSFSRYGATIFVFDCVMTTAFSVRGRMLVMADAKLPKAERTAQIKDVIARYRKGERSEVRNA